MKWIDCLSILGTIASIIGICISIAIYKKQKKSQDMIDDYTSDSFNNLKKYEQISYDLLVSIVNNDLKNLSKDGESSDFWNFKWRFETWNILTLHWKGLNSHVRVKILGTNFDFRINTFDDAVAYPAYICEILESTNDEYAIGSKVVCFYLDNGICISTHFTNVGPPEEANYSKVFVGSLGNVYAEWVNELPASDLKIFPRMKDVKLD